MGEISMSGSTREGGAAVIGLRASHPVLSPLLYWFNPPFRRTLCGDRVPGLAFVGVSCSPDALPGAPAVGHGLTRGPPAQP